MDLQAIAQLCGCLAAALGFWAMSRKEGVEVKRWLLAHTVMYGLHFGLLGAPVAVAANMIALVRIYASMRSRSWAWVVVLCLFSVGVGVYSTEINCVSGLPLAASIVLTITLFRLTGWKFRCGLLIGCLLWLVHNIFVGSIGGVVLETGMSISTLVGWYRERNFSHETSENCRRGSN